MEENTNYCVYCHTNLTNGKKYVGITCKKPEVRWRNGARYDHNSYFYRSIQFYGWNGFSHEVLHSNLTHEEACELEKKYIREWNLRDRDFGYNMTDGGEGCYGRVASAETRKKQSESRKGIGLGKKLSDEHKAKISQAMIGVPHPHKYGNRKPISDEVRKILSDAHKMPVDMYTKGGEFVRSFSCAAEGAQFVGLKTSGDISKCCSGKRKSAGGYAWRYPDDKSPPV